MKLVLFGAVANNLYVFARSLDGCGRTVEFLRDRTELAPISQPSWEDVSTTVGFQEMAAARWSRAAWDEWERRHGWSPPAWYRDPQGSPWIVSRPKLPPLDWIDSALLRIGLGRHPEWQPILDAMASADLVMVCGAFPLLTAMASGKPYLLWPHGGEMRTAAGLQPPAATLRDRFSSMAIGRLLRTAISGAVSVATHDPTGLAGHLGPSTWGLRADPDFLPIPMPLRPRASKEQRRRALASRLTRLGVQPPQAELVGFVPSRQDFFWKGQDRLIAGLAAAGKAAAGIHLMMAGWGVDYDRARQRVQLLGLEDRFTFLPFALTKPLLLELFDASDLVVDQLRMGTYGTAAVEAMAGGCPVMMHIDATAYEARGWPPPPVIPASDEPSVAERLSALGQGRIDLEAVAAKTREWAAAVHSPDAVLPIFERLAEKCASGNPDAATR